MLSFGSEETRQTSPAKEYVKSTIAWGTWEEIKGFDTPRTSRPRIKIYPGG